MMRRTAAHHLPSDVGDGCWSRANHIRCVSAEPVTDARAGFSLLEVMIATAILMGSAVVLARLAGMGRDQSQKARIYSMAQSVCEQTMNEMLLGLRPLEVAELAPLSSLAPAEDSADDKLISDQFAASDTLSEIARDEANPAWRYTVRFEPLAEFPGMWSLTVMVQQGDETLERPLKHSLTRWLNGPVPEGSFSDLSQSSSDTPFIQDQEIAR